MIFLGAALSFIFLLPYNLALHNLKYSDLEDMGVDCHPSDTCSFGGQSSFYTSNCKCDSQCQFYGDCCIDAEIRGSVTPLANTMCLSDGTDFRIQGVSAINKCQNGWRGPAHVKQRCEYLSDISDPFVAAPATDTDGNVTYRNRYCAECNRVNQSDLQSWIIRLECKSLEPMNSTGNITGAYLKQRLTYKTTHPYRNKWGIYYWNDTVEREIFYPCQLSFELPEYLRNSVRFCLLNVTSTCASNWGQNSVRTNCGAYMAVVYYDSAIYMNPHCALCNHEKLSRRKCALSAPVISRGKEPLPFSLLLDVNLNDGNRVGEINRCPDGQEWDSFFEKCRNVFCLFPGQRREGRKCVCE